MAAEGLLSERPARPWAVDESPPAGLQPAEFYLADGDPTVTVRVADWTGRGQPKREALERLWGTIARKLSVVVLVVRRVEDGREVVDIVGGRTTSGAGAPRPIVRRGTPIAEGRSLCRAVLEEPTSQAAGDLVARWLDERATEVPGLKNDGLFATYTLRHRVPDRMDWPDALDQAKRLRDRAGRELIEHLGFTIKTTDHPRATLLMGAESQRAVALFLDDDESFDDASAKFGNRTPVSTALSIARTHNVPWILLTRGRSVRLHPVSPDKGVGRRGRSTTYAEIDLRLLPEDRAAYLWLLFSASALAEEGSAEQILRDSASYASDLGVRLRDRIYVDVVPALAELVADRMRRAGEADAIDDRWLDEAYRTTMVLLFRTLFVAYAEDRGLLPYERNERYTERSLNRVAQVLDRVVEEETPFDDHDESLWDALTWTWTTVAKGNREAGVPPYGGGLFEEHSFLDRALRKAPFTNAEVGPILADLLLDRDEDGELGPVDFRSLSVREFGTIYEGLLESELSIAETDLALDREGNYIPLAASHGAPTRRKKSKEPGAIEMEATVRAGSIYFHNRSGARKSSGTYFTKPFVVEHLLDQALEPAIRDHLERVAADLQRGDEAAAGERFFDFRVADIAMGSGHFLIAAIDRIEARFGDFLAEHRIDAVRRELAQLRAAAIDGLGGSEDSTLVEDAALLRRQIARRCIYGVDLNRVAVELARLAVWIHTFVPGLPLSYLDHTLVVGNSLTGVGTLDEAETIVIDPTSGRASFAAVGVREELARALPALERLRTVSDTTVKDVQAAAAAHAEARTAVAPLSWLLDLLVLQRAGVAGVALLDTDPSTVELARTRPEVREALHDLAPLHFPTAFPEVFLRDSPGFDCLVGNPPWDELFLNEDKYWVRHFPGHMALPSSEREAARRAHALDRPDLLADLTRQRALASRVRAGTQAMIPEGHGTSVLDLHQAFSWRATTLLAPEAYLGYVLPRAAMAGASQTKWRTWASAAGGFLSVANIINRNGWCFDDVKGQLQIVLVTYKRGSVQTALHVYGRFTSAPELRHGERQSLTLSREDWQLVSPALIVPSLPSQRTADVFRKFLVFPRLGGTRVDFSATARCDGTAGHTRGYIGDSGPDRDMHVVAGRHIDNYVCDVVGRAREIESSVVPERCIRPYPVLAFRQISRADDSRTLRVALVPPMTFIKETAYWVDLGGSRPRIEAFLLAILNSRVVDWYVRCLVDMRVLPSLFHALPVPEFDWGTHTTRRLTALGAEMARPADALAPWRESVTLIAKSPAEAEFQRRLAEIDLLVAQLYGLEWDDLESVMRTFHPTWEPDGHLAAMQAAQGAT